MRLWVVWLLSYFPLTAVRTQFSTIYWLIIFVCTTQSNKQMNKWTKESEYVDSQVKAREPCREFSQQPYLSILNKGALNWRLFWKWPFLLHMILEKTGSKRFGIRKLLVSPWTNTHQGLPNRNTLYRTLWHLTNATTTEWEWHFFSLRGTHF